MTQRYHKAARDGLLDILKETTRKDCNSGDEDGMTPTLWAAFEGNLEALSLLVGRGGDPSKCDHFGNTALHLASAKGHMDCVKFLVNFGANIFSLDIDMHTPKELAAMNDCQEILRYLDDIAADQELENAKKVKTLQDKAEKEAQKLMKNFKKIQKKADKMNEKEKKILDKEMQKLEIISSSDNADNLDGDSSNSSSTGNGSNNGVGITTITTTIGGGGGGFTKFSEITNNNSNSSSSSNGKKLMGTVSKKLNLKKSQAKVDSGSGSGLVPTFSISEVEDGKRSMRHLKGRRQSANVLFVPKNLEPIEDKEDELLDVKFPNPLFHQNQRKSIAAGMTGGASMFDRPGMGGSIAFRNSMTATLFSFNKENNTENSIGSAGSLVNEDEDDQDQLVHEELPPFSEADFAPVAIFLAGLGMEDWITVFKKEEIDIHALTLLQEEDLKSMGLAMGPRKKVITAIEDRRKAMKEDQLIQDSQL